SFVKGLYKRKMISKEEMDTASTTSLFNKYYFSSEDIKLTELAGLQYSNYGIFNLEDKNFDSAVDEFKKAFFLFPSERHKFMLKKSLLHVITNNDYDNMQQVYYLVTLCHFNNSNDEDISNEKIKYEFVRITESQLIDNSDYSKFDSSYFLISGALTDSGIRNDIDFAYHYELARLGFLNFKDTLYEISHLEKAYAINPNHANLQSIILGYFGRIVERY